MGHLILIDEPGLRECVESNIYQSCHFGAGQSLARALMGEAGVTEITPRIVPVWHREVLYLLKSRTVTGYLLVSPAVFREGSRPDDVLHVFQRVCRFALKIWNGLSFAHTERWSQLTDCGVVFPFPHSVHTGFRVALRKGYGDPRYTKRHGVRHLFAFASGTDVEAASTPDDEALYKKAFEGLTAVRTELAVDLGARSDLPCDLGPHSLTLSDTNHAHIRYQTYDLWLTRLTAAQEEFVKSDAHGPQRVEGPAGTGKTLCLLLRAFYLCDKARRSEEECRVLFVAHSEATREAIAVAFDALGGEAYHRKARNASLQSVELCTLQQWCGSLLGSREIASAQYLDQDALAAKEMRKLVIKDVVEARMSSDPESLEYLSPACRSFFQEESTDYIAELMQHEIGVMIKGRASENLESYLDLPAVSFCLPARSSNDRRFVFSLYKAYQKHLNASGVYDTDDIVLTALGRMDTPIWRRRRATEGYDAVVIDETHLFNLNELSVFHCLLRREGTPFIVFSIDRSQAPGERGITTRLVRDVLTGSSVDDQATRTLVIFRCSPQIVRLAEAVTAAGATLFTTFENPLVNVSSVITAADEALAEPAVYWECVTDERMCEFAVGRAKAMSSELKCPVSEILIVATTQALVESVRIALEAAKQRCVQLVQRGDLQAVRRGADEGAVILSHPDFVGGLEFRAVLIVGVDEGRMPPTEGVKKAESRHFVEFGAFNRLYVAITRARLAVELFSSKERGRSPLLRHAAECNAVELREAEQGQCERNRAP